jgi:hypothetical protein
VKPFELDCRNGVHYLLGNVNAYERGLGARTKQMRKSIVAFLLTVAASPLATASDDFNFHLPSSLVLTASSSNDDTKTVGADLNLSFLETNRQVSVGYTRSNLELNGDQFSFNEFRLGIGSDPLETFSYSLQGIDLNNGSDTEQVSVDIGLTYSPASWIFSLTPGIGVISSSNRPNIYKEESKLRIVQTSIELAAESFIGSGFSLRPFGVAYSYDGNLNYFDHASQISQSMNVDVIPPSSQELFTSLPQYQYGLGFNYGRTKWSLGLEGVQTKTILDSEVAFSFSLTGTYRILKKWSVLGAFGQLPTVSGDYSSSNRSVRLGLIRIW